MHSSSGVCGKCHGVMKIVFGALLLVNAFLWPKWLGIDGWIAFVAALMVIFGLIKLLKPACGHCEVEKPAKKKKKK